MLCEIGCGGWDAPEIAAMFAFFSNRLGCFGSILVSVLGTLVLLALMKGCQGGL
jgi:hypothetical protein